MRISRTLASVAAFLLIGLNAATAAEYKSDPTQSELKFQASSRLGKANGQFHDFSVTADVDESALEKSSFTVTINVDTIDTGIKGRDKHLRSPDFFNTSAFPTSIYKSVSIEKTADRLFLLHGDLSLHGVTRKVDIPIVVTKFGAGELAATGEISIDRKEFGIDYNSWINPIKNSVEITFGVLLRKTAP